MFNGLKNFALNRILRHIADDPRLNHATNILALIPVAIGAAIAANADWTLMLACCNQAGSLSEAVRILGCVLSAILLYYCGKFPGLKQWLPIAADIIREAEKEAVKPAAK